MTVLQSCWFQVVSRLIHILGDRIFGQMQHKLGDGQQMMVAPNLTTVAVLAVNTEVPIDPFCMELELAFQELGTTLRLNSRLLDKLLGPAALEAVNEYR